MPKLRRRFYKIITDRNTTLLHVNESHNWRGNGGQCSIELIMLKSATPMKLNEEPQLRQ